MIIYPKGKYFSYDLADFIFWYFESELGQPISHYNTK